MFFLTGYEAVFFAWEKYGSVIYRNNEGKGEGGIVRFSRLYWHIKRIPKLTRIPVQHVSGIVPRRYRHRAALREVFRCCGHICL